MEPDKRLRARRLLDGLAAYQSGFELMCISVSCGGRKVGGSPNLPGLYRDHHALLPDSGSRFVQMIVAHREAVRTLCKLRDSRSPLGGEAMASLRLLRRQHADAVDTLMADVRRLAA